MPIRARRISPPGERRAAPWTGLAAEVADEAGGGRQGDTGDGRERGHEDGAGDGGEHHAVPHSPGDRVERARQHQQRDRSPGVGGPQQVPAEQRAGAESGHHHCGAHHGDGAHGPADGTASGTGVAQRVQPHGEVRQTGGAEQESGLEADQVEAPGEGVAEVQPGVRVVGARLGAVLSGVEETRR